MRTLKDGLESTYFKVEQDDVILVLDGKNKPDGVTWGDIGKSLRDFRVIHLTDDVSNENESWGQVCKPETEDNRLYFTDESLEQAYSTFVDELQAAEAADDTDIEEEIQKVLKELKTSNIYGNTYLHLLTILDRLIDIREKI